MALRLLRRDPSLSPLFLAVGTGVLGAAGFGLYYLRNSPDVIVRKSGTREPWNDVEQHRNTKLFNVPQNKEFWASRAEMPHPRAMFMSGSPSISGEASLAKAKAIRAAKDKANAKGDDGIEIGKSVMGDELKEHRMTKESAVEH
ncbi:hypothetical protein JCM10212_004507 [Sporobolomyces blumeae]